MNWLKALWARYVTNLPIVRNLEAQNKFLSSRLSTVESFREQYGAEAIERAAELVEARQMAGTGPWLVQEARAQLDQPGKFREANPITSQGAFGDIELALQNIEWRREINLSWLEFSRWGIQQIILISRLYYVKNPLIQRGINVAAHYVFGRGFEISSPDDAANDVIKQFLEDNRSTIGQIACAQLEKRCYYDGQVFFVLFPDRLATGKVKLRTIDATEIQDVITNPDDTDEPRYYRRIWTQRNFNAQDATVATVQQEAWYPAMNYEPEGADRLDQINGIQVRWDSPVYHMRGGTGVSKWHFDVPIVYAALDWAKAARKYLEACASVKHAVSQVAMTLSTKGGMQALEGYKNQMQTNVNSQPGNSLWDTNPDAVSASTFASGPGTVLTAFNSRGAGGDPEEVRRYIHMVAIVFGIPETFFADASTGSLATAQSLDRPTELRFLECQERWRETFVALVKFALRMSATATDGRLRASLIDQDIDPAQAQIRETPRTLKPDGRWVYVSEARKPSKATIEVQAQFPAIREGDTPQLVQAAVQAMTLGTQEVIGIDEREGVKLLYRILGIDNADELVDEMYPDSDYEPDRTQEPEPAPQPDDATPAKMAEAARLLRVAAKRIKGAA